MSSQTVYQPTFAAFDGNGRIIQRPLPKDLAYLAALPEVALSPTERLGYCAAEVLELDARIERLKRERAALVKRINERVSEGWSLSEVRAAKAEARRS